MCLRKQYFIVFFLVFVFLSCDEDSDNPISSTDPAVMITSPIQDQAVTDIVKISASASDDVGVAKVIFYIDAESLFVDPVTPYEADWNTSALSEGSEHSIFAVVFDTDGNSRGSATIVVTIDSTMGVPETPILFAIDSISGREVRLTWSMNNEADFSHYTVYYDTSASGDPAMSFVVVANATDTTLVVSDLLDITTYKFQVEVSDIFQKSSKSNVLQLTTQDIAPPTPTIVRIDNHIDSITMYWSQVAMTDFLSYELFESLDSLFDGSDMSIATINDYNTLSFDYILADTLPHFYFLVLKDIGGAESISDPVFFDNAAPNLNFALDFDGTTYATVPYFAALDVGDSYTLEAWVFQRAGDAYDRVIDKSPTGSPYLQYSLISATTLGADVCNGTGGPARYFSNAGVALNEWHHVALTYDAGLITYYIDGQAIDADTTGIVSTCAYATTLNIGRRKLFDEFYFRGIIDDVRVWNVVRTPVEMAAAFNTSLVGNETGLVVYFDFDERTGDVINSPVGGNGHLGDLSGVDSKDPQWVISTAPIQ